MATVRRGDSAAPAAVLNAVNGQLSFLVAALIVAGLRLLKTYPLAAGAALGFFSVKSQFCLLVPVVLVALRRWQAVLVMIGSGAGQGEPSSAFIVLAPSRAHLPRH
jgi:hypothetical protein